MGLLKKQIIDKKWPIFLLVYFAISFSFVYSQNYTVESHQKTNETNGGFTGILDLQDNLGVAVDNIGDLDGNGVNDIAVGAFGDDDGGSNQGAVWILFLDAQDMVISQTKISDTSGGFTGDLDNDDRFGGGVAYLGDMNGDGLIELAVTADYDGDGGFWSGAFYVLSLNNDGTVNSHTKISDTQGNFAGNINGGAIFGTDIENIGDLNGDGIDDLAVGSRRDSDGGANRGALWILFMNTDFTVNTYQKVSSTDGNFTGVLQFEDFFGGSVANIGDLDNDGVVDLAVGAYRDDDGSSDSGSIYILFMNIDGTVKNHQIISNSQGGLTYGISADALFGESIDGVLDIDADGRIEIVVGAMKQINPTLLAPTGGFFIIELNNDGTVSEEHFYSYAENCFSGQLQSGDLFAGAVTILSDVSGDVSIAVGAYRDSENGTNKGAVWILNLGEVMFSISDSNNPTACGTSDGSFVISDLVAGSNYTLTYDFASVPVSASYMADTNGEIIVSGLSSGIYENINATEAITGCSDDLGQVILGSSSLLLSISGNEPSACGAFDGSLIISGGGVGLDYTINYELGSQMVSANYTTDSTGEITIVGLASGTYENIVLTENSASCTDNLGDVVLNSSTFYTSLTTSQPTGCDTMDGSLLISGVTAGNEYTVNYEFMSQTIMEDYFADVSGEIHILNLQTGSYDNITVTEITTTCSNSLGSAVLQFQDFSVSFESFSPSACGAMDGSFAFSGASGGLEYTISYEIDSQTTVSDFTADTNGNITIPNLDAGLYENMVVTENATGCVDSLGSAALECVPPENECFIAETFFTPNGDDINDYWSLKPIDGGCDYSLSIFDRYGKLLVMLNPTFERWDGTFQGFQMPATDYWYVVNYTDGIEVKVYRSHFTLKR